MVGLTKIRNLSFICTGIGLEVQTPHGNARYVGEHDSGKAHGEGVATVVSNKSITYTGMFLNNELHGKGIEFLCLILLCYSHI